jgi:DNA repair protein RecN (Recombination protein N)
MLRALRVRNLAVVEDASLDLGPGLNLVTGETGAGKSLLVDAIALLLGARADREAVRTGEESARVEGVFDATPPARARLEDLGLDGAGGEVILRREIRRDRSRAFVNDSPVTVETLRGLGELLGEVHGQGGHQTLLHPAEHRRLLDARAGLAGKVERIAGLHAELADAEARLARLRGDEGERERRLDLLEHQVGELEGAGLDLEELESLRREQGLLRHLERVRELSAAALAHLQEEGSAAARLGAALSALEEAAELTGDPDVRGAAEELREASIRAEEASRALSSWASRLDADPARLGAVEERLAALERVVRKYGGTAEAALEFLEGARRERAELRSAAAGSGELEERVEGLRRRYGEGAAGLSRARRKAARPLAAALEDELDSLGLPGTRFAVRIEPHLAPGSGVRVGGEEVRPGPSGADRIEFLLSTNPGEEPRPLNRVASGGELSRVMLALRTAGLKGAEARTLVFDEVDSGVGGASADFLGRRLDELAAVHQVLCVTHLPQVAARAHHHLAVRKGRQRGRTRVRVEPVRGEERVREVARMLGGASAAEKHARALVAAGKGGA